MKIHSLLFRLLKVFGVVALGFIAIVLTMNLSFFDEELSPEVVNLIKPSPIPNIEGNAYYAFFGIASSGEKQLIETGVNLVKRYIENRDNSDIDGLTDDDLDEILGGKNLDSEWKDIYKNCNSRKEFGCLLRVSNELKENPKFSDRLILQLERYDEILGMAHFQHLEHLTDKTPLPYYGTLMRLSQIRLASFYNRDETSLFIQKLTEDLKFWRMILSESSTMIDKMVAVASILKDLQYLSELMATHNLLKEEQQMIHRLLTSITKEEINMTRVFNSEMKVVLLFLKSWKTIDSEWNFNKIDSLVYLFAQKNSTMNLFYKTVDKSFSCFSKMSAIELSDTLRNNKQELPEVIRDECYMESIDKLSMSPANLYNIGARHLIPKLGPAYAAYIARIHDLNGMINLIKLQLSLKQINNKSIEEVIENAEIKNPYTGKSMDYDKVKGLLSFECLDKNSSCKVKL